MCDYDIKFVNKEITPFGGLSLFLKMLEKCHFAEHLEMCDIPSQGSNRGYKPLQLILGMFAGVWCGASCFGHLDVVRYDASLCKLLGWKRGADHRAYQRYFNKFSQAVNQRVFCELFRWFFSELIFDNYTLDFDSTVMVREGNQEGAVKGYNPKRPGRPSHHPLLAFVSDVRMIANYWLRPGNTSAGTNYLAFLEDTLSRLQDKKVGLIRMDSGFFSGSILDYLEQKCLHYIIACRFNNRVKYSLTHEKVWTEVAEGLEIAETTYQAEGWEKPRRIVMADNFMSLFRHALINSDKKKFLKTIRYELISTPAYLGKTKDKHILYLARSLKTRQSFLSIWEKLKDFSLPYSAEKS